MLVMMDPNMRDLIKPVAMRINLIQKMSLDVCLYRFLIFPKIHLEIISSLIRTMKTTLQFLVVMKGMA